MTDSVTEFLKRNRSALTVLIFFGLLFLFLHIASIYSSAEGSADKSKSGAGEVLYCNVSIYTPYGGGNFILPLGISPEDALKMCGVDFDGDDIIESGNRDKIKEGSKIKLIKVDKESFSYTETIPCDTVYEEVRDIPKGTMEIVSEGEDGAAVVYSEIEYRNGVKFAENVLKKQTVKEPSDKVIKVGVGGTLVGKDGEVHEYSYYIDMVATAYYGSGYTKSGKWVKPGMIAVDPRVLDLGTKVYLTGEFKDYGVVSCEDTGGFIKGKRIDIYMLTLEECCEFGRRPMRVYILKDQEKYSYVTE